MDAQSNMLSAQVHYLRTLRSGKTPAMKAEAQQRDKESHAELNFLRASGANAQCFDCDAKKPGWAVLPHGVYICIDCAQVHRNLGRHISQVKAINTGTYLWFSHEMAVMRAAGNETAAAELCPPPKISAGATAAEKHARALALYEPAAARYAAALSSSCAPPPEAARVGPAPAGPTRATAPPIATLPRSFQAAFRETSSKSAREPAAEPRRAEPDLISLLDAEPPPRAAPASPLDGPVDPFGEFEAAPPAQPARPAQPAAVPTYAHKKAQVLSLFQQQPCAATARATPHHKAAVGAGFFAQYGL